MSVTKNQRSKHLGALFVFCAAMVLSTFATNAQAQVKAYAGGLLGLSIPSASNTSARMAYGILGGARIDNELGFGGFYFTSSKDETSGGVSAPFDYSIYGLEGSFAFDNIATNFYVGARVALTKIKVGTIDFSPFAWGLHLGYDYMLNPHLSIGGEAGFLSVGSATNGASSLQSHTDLNFFAAVKGWF